MFKKVWNGLIELPLNGSYDAARKQNELVWLGLRGIDKEKGTGLGIWYKKKQSGKLKADKKTEDSRPTWGLNT